MAQRRKAKGAFVRTETTNGKNARRGKGQRSLKEHLLHGDKNDKIEVLGTRNVEDKASSEKAFDEILSAAVGLRARSDRTAIHAVINPPPGTVWTAEQEKAAILEYLKHHHLLSSSAMMIKHTKQKSATVDGKAVAEAHYHIVASILDLDKGSLVDLNRLKLQDDKVRAYLKENMPESPFYTAKNPEARYNKKQRAMSRIKFGKEAGELQQEIIDTFRKSKTREDFNKRLKEKGIGLGKSTKYKQGRVFGRKDEKGIFRGMGFGPSKIKKLLPEKEQKKFAAFTAKPIKAGKDAKASAGKNGKGKGAGNIVGSFLSAIGEVARKSAIKQFKQMAQGNHPVMKLFSIKSIAAKEKFEAKQVEAEKKSVIDHSMSAYQRAMAQEAAAVRPMEPFAQQAKKYSVEATDKNAALVEQMNNDFANCKSQEERELLEQKWGALKDDLEKLKRYGDQAATSVLRPTFSTAAPSFGPQQPKEG